MAMLALGLMVCPTALADAPLPPRDASTGQPVNHQLLR